MRRRPRGQQGEVGRSDLTGTRSGPGEIGQVFGRGRGGVGAATLRREAERRGAERRVEERPGGGGEGRYASLHLLIIG